MHFSKTPQWTGVHTEVPEVLLWAAFLEAEIYIFNCTE
jgi:hypothetical protein